MEVPGIEPGSLNASTKASTCVVCYLISSRLAKTDIINAGPAFLNLITPTKAFVVTILFLTSYKPTGTVCNKGAILLDSDCCVSTSQDGFCFSDDVVVVVCVYCVPGLLTGPTKLPRHATLASPIQVEACHPLEFFTTRSEPCEAQHESF